MSSEARAVQHDNVEEIAEWCGGVPVVQHDALDLRGVTPGVNVPVGDDVERATVGDVVIRKHDGTFMIFKGYK